MKKLTDKFNTLSIHKKRLIALAISLFIPLYLETIMRALTIGKFDYRYIYTVLFCIPFAGVLFILTVFSSKKPLKIVYNCIVGICCIWCCVQLVYYAVFQGFLSISFVDMGANAMTTFSSQVWHAILQSLPGIILLILPLVLSIIATKKGFLLFEKSHRHFPFIVALGTICAHVICVISLIFAGTGPYSVYDAYHSSNIYTDTSVRNLGVFVTTRLEIEQTLMRWFNLTDDDSITSDEKDTLDALSSNSSKDDDEQAGYEEEIKEYNVLDVDFTALQELASDGNIASIITEVFAQREPTEKNEYTGMFEGYNLISFCAESFSPAFIDKELTPTLYKLTHEGIVFENFYASFESVTTNGEYAACMGMFPDLSRNKSDSSFSASQTNTLPYTLGSMFSSIGADTYAYHNNVGTYYDRYLTHPNMGYEVFKTPDNGIDMEVVWPSSDLEMVMKTVDDYIDSGKQFHAYYMTFSGHFQYTWDNPMSAKNRDRVEHLDYSDNIKAYIACNLELEDALTYLIQRLEDAGIADKTVIVLTSDHYPYGLVEEEYNELSGKEIDPDFERFHNSFICWNSGMEETVKIDKLCSTIDILPTLLNLFGFDYDSRFIVGRDILSPSTEGLAILSNQSFITEKFKFNAVDNELIMLTDEDVPEEDIEHMKSFVRGTLVLSSSILKSDYYRYLEAHLNGETELPPKAEIINTPTEETTTP